MSLNDSTALALSSSGSVSTYHQGGVFRFNNDLTGFTTLKKPGYYALGDNVDMACNSTYLYFAHFSNTHKTDINANAIVAANIALDTISVAPPYPPTGITIIIR